MRRFISFIACALVLMSFTPKGKSDVELRVNSMLKKMTLEEKVGQMAQITLDVIAAGGDRYSSAEPLQVDKEKLRHAVVKYHVGSVLNTTNNRARDLATWNRTIGDIQEVATKETRLKIPIIYGIDAIHGATYSLGATMFPQQIGLAATWNPTLARKMGEIAAYETRACSIPWNFSPVLDLGADPRFSRQFEGFGEDPYLGSVLGVQLVKGYEGDSRNIAGTHQVASCIKHFLGYAVPTSGKDRTPAYIPDNVLHEYHLPAFKAAIDAGATTIMINSGIINGVPVHANPLIITNLLKKELGFKGLVVTDWGDIENLYRRDRVAGSVKEAVKMAVNAGIDMSMIAYQYEEFCDALVELVKSGEVKQSRVDDAVRKILRLKLELGLFEKPVSDSQSYPLYGSDEFGKVAYASALESITLLKNSNGILPLTKGSKILVAGPNANSMRPLNGGWSYSWQGEKTDEYTERFNTFYEAISRSNGDENTRFVPGVSYDKDIKYYKSHKDRFDEVLAAAHWSDVVVLCLGENSYTEKPGDLQDMHIDDLQVELATEVAKSGKPVILVLNEGRPRVISRIESLANGVIQTYLPSNYGGDALAAIIFGDENPSGKLPYTYPSAPNSLVPYYHKPSEEQKKMVGAYDYEGDYNPQYEFGFGLSYTTFSYSNMKVSKVTMGANEEFSISVDVTNTGKRAGKEVVQLYSSDLVASITPDVKRLRRFEKIELKPNETKTVVFSLSTRDLAFVDMHNRWIVEPGQFELRVGNLSQLVIVK